jgi:hypothetical protein
MRIPRNLLAFFIVCLIATLAAAQESKTLINIVVTDPSGAVVPHAQIRLVPAPNPLPSVMETDAKGKLRLDLLPGGYALFVNSSGFKRSATHVMVQRATEGQTITVSLLIAPAGSHAVYSPGGPTLLLSALPYHEDLRLTAADLKTLPHVSVSIHNPHTNTDESYSGVRLSDLLAKMDAPLGTELHGFALASYVVATGSDGYQAIFSLAEVDPSFHPGEILVADTMNGAPLDATTGPFRLVVTEDKRPARSVRNLVVIELKSAD